MSKFTQSVKKTFEFDGDTVAVSLARIKRGQMLQLSPHIPGEGEAASAEQNLRLLEEASKFLPEVLKGFSGLADANGDNISLETMMDEAYFQPLLAEIISAWLETSAVSADEVGNSDAPAGAGTEESGRTPKVEALPDSPAQLG